ncbi:MAG TPA: PaaI family thioesterase [Solirubrobacteraceae bacterium]|jgi:uncharacterized protein (TIGR00369 family)|nr:PaaI family thioesterase [Solirubrobacteraceae bacterium]
MTRSAQQDAVFATFASWQRGDLQLAPVTELLGIEPLEIADGQASVRMAAAEKHHNVFGTVHGGLLCALADVAMGIALATMLDSEGFTTLEQHMDHLRSTRGSVLTAIAVVTRRGRQAAHLKCTILDADERIIAEASSVCLIFALDSA